VAGTSLSLVPAPGGCSYWLLFTVCFSQEGLLCVSSLWGGVIVLGDWGHIAIRVTVFLSSGYGTFTASIYGGLPWDSLLRGTVRNARFRVCGTRQEGIPGAGERQAASGKRRSWQK
jgi:hypothetical protein